VVVYLREAHAMDEWPMGNHVTICQPTTLGERADAAKRFRSSTGLAVDDIYVDGIEDGFMNLFSAHPQRFFVIDGSGTLRLKATPFEGEYSLDHVDACLSDICNLHAE